MSNTSELQLMGSEELEGRLGETRRELLNLRFQAATGQLDNSARIGRVRKEVARLLTVLRQREIAEAEGEPVVTTTAPSEPTRRPRAAGRAEPEATGAAQAGADDEIEEDEIEEEEEPEEEA